MNSKKIQQFLRNTEDISKEQYEIVVALREIIESTNPSATQEIKYNGLVFNVGSELITGIFTRKSHLSLEFSFGAGFDDPKAHLDGKGKLRRHLKIVTMDDITTKDVKNFVTQSFDEPLQG